MQLTYRKGLKDGIPIFLAYLSVSFTFGIAVARGHLPVLYGVALSLTNLTSAGQFAALDILLASGGLFELFIATFVINMRYSLMSLSLSQKLPERLSRGKRMLIAFFNTDEIFAVSMSHPGEIPARYFLGVATLPYLGWALGTVLGGTVYGILPDSVAAALGIAIYGMFIAILIPPMKKERAAVFAVFFAIALSCAFRYLPLLSAVPSGWSITVTAVTAAGVTALLFPLKGDEAR